MGKYDDIIEMPHHVSKDHKQMPIKDRAAQFASFKALTGFEDELTETARLTDKKIELSEQALTALNEKVSSIMQCDHPTVTVRYFVPDASKDGGKYETYTGTVKRMDEQNRLLVFTDKQTIRISDILDMDIYSQNEK